MFFVVGASYKKSFQHAISLGKEDYYFSIFLHYIFARWFLKDETTHTALKYEKSENLRKSH